MVSPWEVSSAITNVYCMGFNLNGSAVFQTLSCYIQTFSEYIEGNKKKSQFIQTKSVLFSDGFKSATRHPHSPDK